MPDGPESTRMAQQRHERRKIAALRLTSERYFRGSETLL
jgi:hypothetical protein